MYFSLPRKVKRSLKAVKSEEASIIEEESAERFRHN
jgi:hypothetical protein